MDGLGDFKEYEKVLCIDWMKNMLKNKGLF